MQIRARNSMIDLIKIFTCPFILLIHCPLSGDVGEAVTHFGRFGVPFFLLVSGWFSYAPSTEKMIERAKKKMMDTVKLLGTFLIAYVIMNSISSCLSGKMCFSWILEYVNLRSAANLVIFNRALFFGSTGYYPFMLLYVYIIFLVLTKWKLVEKAFLAIPVLLTINLVLPIVKNVPWFYYGNFLFTGLPLFLLGHWLHKIYEKLPANPILWCVLFSVGVGLTFAEVTVKPDGYCFAGSILMAVALLLFSVNCTYEVKNTVWLNMLKRFSIYIFVIHCGIRDVLRAFLNRSQIVLSNNTVVFLIVLVTLVICVAWDFIVTIRKKKL